MISTLAIIFGIMPLACMLITLGFMLKKNSSFIPTVISIVGCVLSALFSIIATPNQQEPFFLFFASAFYAFVAYIFYRYAKKQKKHASNEKIEEFKNRYRDACTSV